MSTLVFRTTITLAVAVLTACGPTAGGSPDSAVLFDAPSPDAPIPDAYIPRDASPLDPDAACASAAAEATVETLPVDIIWVVDNSISMAPAIQEVQAGLDDFAALIAASALDYRVILLSLRGQGVVSVGGSNRYALCIPPPLSGDSSCGDGPNFFHVSADIRSTQPIEQVLGTLAQSAGYSSGESRGSDPWLQLLRPTATKSFVFVTDDNARICTSGGSSCNPVDPPVTVSSLADFPGGPNPFNSNQLGPGVTTATYGTQFQDFKVHGIYGWGSPTDPGVRCSYSDGSQPPSSGPTYTSLVQSTGGVRGQICDGSSAWTPFFNAVATAVDQASQIDCTIQIPPPPEGMTFERDLINVWVDTGAGPFRLGKVTDAGACDAGGGWHYDNDTTPTAVVLCPATCDALQAVPDATRSVEVQFGCETIIG